MSPLRALTATLSAAAAALAVGCAAVPRCGGRSETVDEGFVSIFNGRDLEGWTGATAAYGVDPAEPGVLQCFPHLHSHGSPWCLLTEREYGNFVLRFEFMMPENGNSGLAVRAGSSDESAAYDGFCEIQLLDDGGSYYYDERAKKDKQKSYQYSGSVFGVLPSRRDRDRRGLAGSADFSPGGSYMMKPGLWNFAEVRVVGTEVEVFLNGHMVTVGDLSRFGADGSTPDGRPHPGLAKRRGRIGWVGCAYNVKWRNIRVRELPEEAILSDVLGPSEVPPCGFAGCFDGVEAKGGWSFRDGALFFDGSRDGGVLSSAAEFGDFELWADWRLLSAGGESGLCLRGVPQVAVWDAASRGAGSGAISENWRGSSRPLAVADRPLGDWNRLRVKMKGDLVTVWLNGVLVVDGARYENSLDRGSHLPAVGPVALRATSPVEWRNVFVR